MIFFRSRALSVRRAGDFSIGESVWLMENGALTEYFVVQQGNPDPETYTDPGADGTWVMMRGVSDYGTVTFGGALSACREGFYLNRFPANVQAAIREVTLPIYASGSAEITSKIHFPSSRELVQNVSGHASGSILDYFIDGTNDDRIAYLDGISEAYWLRDAYSNTDTGTIAYYYITTSGARTSANTVAATHGIRPIMILDPDTLFDTNNQFVGL